MIEEAQSLLKLDVASTRVHRQSCQFGDYCIKQRVDCAFVFGKGGSFEVQIDVVLFGFVGQVLHFYPSVVVEVALVPYDYFYSICAADIFYRLDIVRNTLVGRRCVYSVNNYDYRRAVVKVLISQSCCSITLGVPNVKFDFLRLPVLTSAGHIYCLVLVFDPDSWLQISK